MKPETLVKLWKKTDPYLQDNNLQGSHNEEIIKFKILNIIFAMWSSENINKDNVEECEI